MTDRPSWDDYFMKIAEDVATRSTCIRRSVGAIIVKEKRILATGYNGAPTDISHCTPETCLRTKYTSPPGSGTSSVAAFTRSKTRSSRQHITAPRSKTP